MACIVIFNRKEHHFMMKKMTYRILKDLSSSNRKVMEDAFNTIYDAYKYLVFYIALQYVKEKETAEDVTNETFMQFYAHKEHIKQPSQIKSYLARISKNLALNAAIASLKRRESLSQMAVEEDRPDDFATYLAKFSSFLKEEEVDLIILHLLYGFTFREIAQEKQVTVDVISSKYKRALDKVRKHYVK